MLFESDKTNVTAIGRCLNRMLAPSDASQRYQVCADGCSPHRMLLGTDATRLAAMDALHKTDASRNATLPGWQHDALHITDASRNPTSTGVVAMDALHIADAYRNLTLPGWQRWMLFISRMLLANRRYKVGSNGCSSYRGGF